MRRVLLTCAVIAGMLTVSACDPATPATTPDPVPVETTDVTPTPTPVPTAPPALSELALSSEGMGTLRFGEAPDAAPATRMIAEDTSACAEFAPAGSPEATRWRPVALYGAPDTLLFGVAVTGGLLDRIDVFGPEIPTDQGIKVGDPAATVVSAYPAAAVVENDLTDVYVVTGSLGTLQLEVARDRSGDGYWQPAQVDHVVYLHATVAGVAPFTVAASENVAGGCL